MLDHSHNGSSGKNGVWSFSGLGSDYGPHPYSNTLYRGYGWGRIIDSDFLSQPVIWDFRNNAAQITDSAKEQKQTLYQLSRH